MIRRLSIIVALLLTAACFFMIPGAQGYNMGYSDPVGDLDNEGMPNDVIPNVDITELRVDDSGDPVVAELEVAGIIDYDETYDHDRLYYHYHINFDTNGDSDRDCWIEIDTNANTFVFHVPGSSDMEDLTAMFSGQNTSTLRVEVAKAWFGGETIVDISGETTVGDLMNYCDDDVNEDFEGGAPIGDDDDDDDDVVVDDDDDDDVVADDDDDDDTTADDDDDDDSPGFELLLIIPSFIVAILVSIILRRKRE